MNIIRTISTHVAIIFFLSFAAEGKEIYVDIDNMSGIEDGMSWATAFTTIQPAIDVATEGDEVWVAEGTYSEVRTFTTEYSPDNTGALALALGVSLLGGFSGSELSAEERNPTTNITVITGSTARDGMPAYMVVAGETDAILDGFTIEGGRANHGFYRFGAGYSGLIGAGTIRNCLFVDNEAQDYGSAVFGSEESLRIEDSRFDDMPGTVIRGGFNLEIVGCSLMQNGSGLLVSAPGGLNLQDSVLVYKNGVALSSTSTIRVANCLLDGRGGTGSRAVFHVGSIDPNTFEFSARGVYINCTFFGNSSPGGSVIRHGDLDLVMLNCVIWGNDGLWNRETTFSISRVFLGNCVIQDDGSIGDQFYTVENVIHEDPLFVNPAAMNFRLRPGSSAIDAGTAEDAPDDDIEGTPRPLATGFDIGAYEFDPEAEFTDPFDPTGDNEVNSTDIQHVINQVLGTTTPITDLNNDGQTNAADIQLIINRVLGLI